MTIKVFQSELALGVAAAELASALLRETIYKCGRARIIAATATSQFVFMRALTVSPGINWQAVELFHLDEYVGLPLSHNASFRRNLLEHLIKPTGISHYHLLDGEGDAQEVCRRIGAEVAAAPVDVAFVGIGENGHLAFNDPPADFQIEDPFHIVNLDEACRRQQVGEGWFKNQAEVPKQAISMTIRQILKAKKIICIVPHKRKAVAVRAALEVEISAAVPASILRTHPDVVIYLDVESSSLLSSRTLFGAA